jgi:general secretion pathway protein B
MSFILDALKKSETDRQRQSAPALFEVKVAAPRRRFPLWGVGLAALLAANIVFLLWFFMREPPVSRAVQPAQAAAGESPGMVTVPANATYIPANAAPNVTIGPGHSDAGVIAPSIEPPLVEEPVLSSQETSVPPDYDARDYRPAITPEQAAATAAARRAGSLPSRDEVLAQGTQLPELRLDLHVYDADPSKRFVFINMNKLREGETMQNGVRVESITQNGARLSYRGSSFVLEGS